MVMINPAFFKWIKSLSEFEPFMECIGITDVQAEKQFGLELVLRLLAARNYLYKKGQDIHEYLDDAAIALVRNQDLDWQKEEKIFKATFETILQALGVQAFRRWDGDKFGGKFLISVFEVVAVGVAANFNKLQKMSSDKVKAFVKKRSADLWADNTFIKYSGAGVRGSDRFGNLLPLGETFFKG